MPLPKRLFRLLHAAVNEFGQDMAGRFAAALSFYTLFALVPLLFLIVAVVGFVASDSVLVSADCATVTADQIPAGPANPLDRMIAQVGDVTGSAIADQLAQLTCEATASRTQILWIGIALAAFSGSSIFLHIQGVLNFVFRAPDERTKGIVNSIISRGIALTWAVVLALLVMTPLLAVAAVSYLRSLIDAEWLRTLLQFAIPVTSLLLLVGVVAATFQLLTRARVSGRAARRGGLFTAITGLIGAYLVGFYLSRFGGGGALGAVGGVAILLFFFNLMWMIYLFGAEVTKVYDRYLVTGVLGDEPEAVADVDTSVESPWRNGVMAFLIGLVTGWAARRKR